MNFPFSIVKGKTIHDLIQANPDECMRIVEAAYLAHGDGKTVNPNSHFLLFPEKPNSRIIALPASIRGDFNVAGIKWIASFPDNVRRGVPRASAVLVLNDNETGYPFALLESSIISAARTAASAVLAAQHLNADGKRVKRLGLIGNGLIAKYIYNFFMNAGWSVPEVVLFDTNPEEPANFVRNVCRVKEHQRITVAKGMEELLEQCDMIAFATVAGTPHVMSPALLRHNPIVLHISLRDLSTDIILASTNVVDDVDHVMKANTSVHLTEQKVGHRRFVNGTLADLIGKKFELDRSRPIVFSPFGLGVLDLAVGKWVYDRAVQANDVVRFDDFFFELTR